VDHLPAKIFVPVEVTSVGQALRHACSLRYWGAGSREVQSSSSARTNLARPHLKQEPRHGVSPVVSL
jgi:hypothetical protein